MRLLSLSLLLGAAALAAAQDDEEVREPTYFNGQIVPPLLELDSSTYDKEIQASKFMVVKHYR